MTINKQRTIDTVYFANELSTIFNNPKMKSIESYGGNINAFKDKTNDLNNSNYSLVDKNKIDKFEIFNDRFYFLLNKDRDILTNLDEVLIFDSYRIELHFYEMISSIATEEDIKKLLGDNIGGYTIFNQSWIKKMMIKTYYCINY